MLTLEKITVATVESFTKKKNRELKWQSEENLCLHSISHLLKHVHRIIAYIKSILYSMTYKL